LNKEKQLIKILLKLIRIFPWSTSGELYEWVFKKEKQPKERENGESTSACGITLCAAGGSREDKQS
jgi:hypothetical protein